VELWHDPFDPVKGVVFDFADSRAGRHAKAFLGTDQDDGGWRGTLVCDDYAGYKDLFGARIAEAGCLAHARRKFFDLWAHHKSTVAEQALAFFGDLYHVEREVQDLDLDERARIRQLKAKPVADALRAWLVAQRQKVPEGSATAKAIDYSLKRWAALTRYLDDGNLPADNNWIENRIRPIALGRANWLFAGSLRAGQRAAAIMSLIGSARMNALDPYAYLKDVLERLPTHPARRIDELLPHRWRTTTPPH
jgi:transposase